MSDKKEATEKPLDKMTVKELREVASEMPEVTGVHGMKKDELLDAIKKAKGMVEEAPKPKPKPKAKVAAAGPPMNLKEKIRHFKGQKMDALASGDRKAAKILRRRINRLKKKTRRAA